MTGEMQMQKVMDDSDWSAKAWMSKVDANLFDALVRIKSAQTHGKLRVLEWGAGRSTSYYTRALHSLRGDNFCWHAIEYDRTYFDKDMQPALGTLPKSKVVRIDKTGAQLSEFDESAPVEFAVYNHGTLKPMLEEGAEDRKVNMDAYVEHGAKLGRRFDIILVDGRKRRRCLIEASRLLDDGGVAVLHDAQRTYYHCAFENYRSQKLLTEMLWFGMQESTDLFTELRNRAETVASVIDLGIPLSTSVALPQ